MPARPPVPGRARAPPRSHRGLRRRVPADDQRHRERERAPASTAARTARASRSDSAAQRQRRERKIQAQHGPREIPAAWRKDFGGHPPGDRAAGFAAVIPLEAMPPPHGARGGRLTVGLSERICVHECRHALSQRAEISRGRARQGLFDRRLLLPFAERRQPAKFGARQVGAEPLRLPLDRRTLARGRSGHRGHHERVRGARIAGWNRAAERSQQSLAHPGQ